MQPDPALTEISHWLINIGFGLAVAFPVLIRFYWPWNESAWGWNTVSFDLCIGFTLFPSVLHLDFGVLDVPLEWASVVGLMLVCLNIVWRTVLIIGTQAAGARRDRATAAADDDDDPAAAAPAPD